MRALISTYDKTGLDVFARGLADLGWELVASGGTATYLEELGLSVERVESLTEFPEMLGGRVKTLHPRIHAGILARRDNADDVATLAEHEIAPFDLVCINLYPFEQVAAQKGVTELEAVEMIDVGGPSMLRGAAKNFSHVAPVCRPERYGFVLDELRSHGALSLETRRELAAEAFATTAAYEAAIATWFSERETFPETLVVALEKVLDLSYGENPHQRAAYYAERHARTHLLSRVEQLHGKALSFNNLNDLSAARVLAREFALPACVIVKHANPCGVAVGATLGDAYERALASDPRSAYGGIVVLNREVDEALGEQLVEQFVEVLFAPGYSDGALDALRRRENTRILLDRERRHDLDGRHYKRVLGGLLVQDPDSDVEDREGWEVVCGSPDERQWGDLVFA
ncbi:MAG: phosphoribosylaminoimidazolecarboxamide formyltransferase / cyclohydrolase, partial [Gaiellaceae bacterium]|nr:phosphoribosylaminoimidazolecarboxamide formyltransferase / cyclohydrolase [Gaiellaceae bacterium]